MSKNISKKNEAKLIKFLAQNGINIKANNTAAGNAGKKSPAGK